MDTAKMRRVWQICGVIMILYGLYALFFAKGSDAVIFLGGGSAALLLLARKKWEAADNNEADQ